MKTRTISLMCMLVLGTGITAQASTMKAETLRYATASVPTKSVNDNELDEYKRNLLILLGSVQHNLETIETSWTLHHTGEDIDLKEAFFTTDIRFYFNGRYGQIEDNIASLPASIEAAQTKMDIDELNLQINVVEAAVYTLMDLVHSLQDDLQTCLTQFDADFDLYWAVDPGTYAEGFLDIVSGSEDPLYVAMVKGQKDACWDLIGVLIDYLRHAVDQTLIASFSSEEPGFSTLYNAYVAAVEAYMPLAQRKHNCYSNMEELQRRITNMETVLTEAGVDRSESVWNRVTNLKDAFNYFMARLDGANSSSGLEDSEESIRALQDQVQNLQMYVEIFIDNWMDQPIVFADADVELICVYVLGVDENNDHKLSRKEAALVTNLGTHFRNGNDFDSFDELQYFTSLTSIPDYAFENCVSLTTITLPNSVTTIGANAFYGCSQLQTLKMSSKVESIGNQAFGNINSAQVNLTIDCAPSHPVIADELFWGNSALKSVTLGDGITNIGTKAFQSCTGMSSFAMTTSVQTIGENAFTNISEELAFTVDVSSATASTAIADNLFKGIRMKSVTLDDAITGIGVSAFQNCSELTEVRIPSHVFVIKEAAFKECTHLNKVTMSTTLEFIEGEAFTNNLDMTFYIEPTATKTTIGGEYSDGTSIMPFVNSLGLVAVEVMEGVTAIEKNSFSSSPSIWKVTLPSTVTEIGESGFSGSRLLQEIVLNNGLERIGWCAFKECVNLHSVAIPASVNYIDFGAFQDCTNLVEANLPAGLEFVGAQLFQNTQLRKITIPASVTKIWDDAFKVALDEDNCGWLREVTLEQDDPSKIEISGDPFLSPHSNINLNVPFWSADAYRADSYWKDFNIVSSAFFTVDNMVYWVQPNTNEPFAVLQYPVAKSLVEGEVTIPAEITVHGQTFQVTTIAGKAFKDCSNLTGIKLNTALKSVASGAFDGLQDIVITINPYGDQTIVEPNLFKDYSATGSFTVVLGEGITKVGDRAFNNCQNLKALYLPASLESFGEFAFTQVNNLMDVYVKWESPLDIPYSDGNPFFNGNLNSGEKIRLHVPIGKRTTYKGHAYWGQYFDIPNDNDWVGDFVYSAVADADHELNVLVYAGTPSAPDYMAVIPESVEKDGVTYQVTKIYGQIFENVDKIVLMIPESVNYIDNNAFKGCRDITVIVKWQEPLALYMPADFDTECVNKTLLVPVGTSDEYSRKNWDSFMMIEEYIPFADSKVEEICLSNLDGQPSGPKDGVVSVFEAWTAETLPNVDWFAWTKIKSFDELKYFANLTTIGEYAFSHCDKLERITIPRSVTQLGRDAFWFCSSLNSVTVEWDTPIDVDLESSKDPFPSKDGITLFVPEGKKSAYQSHSYWQQFFIAEALDGDADGSGGVNIDDALAIVNYILGQPSDGFVEANADVNGDGKITIADAVSLVNIILN